MTVEQQFESWFAQVAEYGLYPFQVRFACEPIFSEEPSPAGRGKGEGLLMNVPTEMGKTAITSASPRSLCVKS